MIRYERNLLAIIAPSSAFALILVVFFLQAQNHIQKNPLRADEVDYYGSMASVVSVGLPLYYAGEVDLPRQSLIHLSSRRLWGQEFEFYRFRPETKILKETFFALTNGASRYTYGMWHPPLYIYLGSLYFRLAPLTPATSRELRYFNLIFSAGIFAGMFALSRALYQTRPAQSAALAMLLYVLNSLAVRGSILIDYNATLGPCVAVWFAVVYARSLNSRSTRGGYVALGLLMMLAFLSGLGIGLALLVGVGVHAAVSSQVRRSWRTLLAVGCGSLAFLPVFFALSRLLGLPFSQPFLHNFQRVNARLDLNWLTAQGRAAIEYSLNYSREIGSAIVLLALALIIPLCLIQKSNHSPVRTFVPILLIVGFLLHGSLRAEAYGFPKYILFLLPPLFVYVAGEMVDLYAALPSGRRSRIMVGFVLAAVIALEARESALSLQRPGSTLYFAGEQGIESISDETQLLTGPDETILSAKDIAFFADRKFVQWSGALTSDAALLQRRVESLGIRVLASNMGLLGVASPEVSDYLARTFPISVQHADFRALYTPVLP